jgi:uncharacterized protein YpmS
MNVWWKKSKKKFSQKFHKYANQTITTTTKNAETIINRLIATYIDDFCHDDFTPKLSQKNPPSLVFGRLGKPDLDFSVIQNMIMTLI